MTCRVHNWTGKHADSEESTNQPHISEEALGHLGILQKA